MNVKKAMKKLAIPVLLLMCLCIAPTVSAATRWNGIADGEVLIKDTITAISNGVTEHEVITNNSSGSSQKIDYLCEVKLGDQIKLAAGYGKDNADSWSLVPTTVQAEAYEKNHPGETVVAGINADFFNMATGEPLGALVMEGVEKHSTGGRYYFGVTKAGQPVIRNSGDLSDLEMAVGGDALLIDNGKVITENTTYGDLNYSRTAIGIKADGTVVTFVTYGLRAPISCGRTYLQIAQMLKNAGCVYALALDGGGSSTYAGRPEGTTELTVRNSPNDGAERAVSSAILIVSTAEATGKFSHAQLTPNNQLYTPESTVNFTATGVDTAGVAMDLPKGVVWALAEDSKNLGTIDAATGVFQAGKGTGQVTVNLLLNDKVVGTTSIEIVVPDQIYFASTEISLGFEEVSDLGIVVRSKGRDINYKAGDINWSASTDQIGSFVGNDFHSSDKNSVNGVVTATSAYDDSVSGQITVIVGKLPTIVWDFEDKTLDDGTVVSAEDYYGRIENAVKNGNSTTYGNGILNSSNYGRGGNESIQIVSIDDGEPVRFGEKALKLNYDFINCGEVTEGACIGTTEAMEIPGTPTGIGVWVYAPEGVGIEWKGDGTQSGLWLRGYVQDGAGSNKPYDFTLEPKHADVQNGSAQPGIYWEGWKYLEADLTSLQPPYKIQKGMTFRLMFVAGTKMGTRTADAIYFDNLQFVYGTNVDDITSPVVDSMTINGVELQDGMTIDTDTISVDTIFHDVENKFSTGIDHSTVRMYLDGVNLSGNEKYEYAYDQSGLMTHLYNAKLLDGAHSITLSIRDGFGNETVETRHFTVQTGSSASAAVQIAPIEDMANIGGVVNIQIKAADDAVTESTTIFRLANGFKEYEVVFSDNYTGTATYSKLNKTITVNAARKADGAVQDEHLIATLKVKIPDTLQESDTFGYTVTSGSYTSTTAGYGTYICAEQTLPVGAGYSIQADPMVVGTPGVVKVVDKDGKPAANVSVYLKGEAQPIGVTDENGQLSTDRFTTASGRYVIYARDEVGALSFQYNVKSYDAKEDRTGKPNTIRFNTVNDATTQKNITWTSSILHTGKQVVQYAVSGSENWTTVEAGTQKCYFETGNFDVANVNGVLLQGLTPGTTYDYRVGTEGAMSEKATFKTDTAGRIDSSFFVIGDIQDSTKDELATVIDQLQGKSYDFGIQIGDAIDKATDYQDWSELGALLGAARLGDVNMLSVMGNHEYEGDGNADISSAMYNLEKTEKGSYYSVEYGNIYLAVINYATTKEQVEEAANWLIQDAQQSDATWKILSTHQPPYFTNSVGGNDIIYQILPKTVEEAGIDIVFSGHDHSIARTNPLYQNEVDEEKGIIYYVTGAAGEKRYTADTQGRFDYNKLFRLVKSNQEYTATYLTATANDKQITINIYDINDGLLDSLTLKTKCERRGHEYNYDPETKELKCKVCKNLADMYTGEVKNPDGKEYYFVNSVLQTGWVTIGEEIRYYDASGAREEVTSKEKKSTCIMDGYCIYTSASGEEKRIDYNDAGGHEYVEKDGAFVCKKCQHTRIEMADCNVTLNYTQCTYTGKERTPSTKAVAPDGTVLTKTGQYRDYYSKYENNVEVGPATVTLTAAKYGYYVNMNEWRGNCKGSITVTYTIHPQSVKEALYAVDGKRAVIQWNAVDHIDEYVVYTSENGGAWKLAGTTKDTHYTVSGLNSQSSYQFRVGTRKTGTDGKSYESLTYAKAEPLQVTAKAYYRSADGKPLLKWNATDGATYTIYRATSKNGKYVKLNFTTKGTSYTHVSATAGKTYYYKVKATLADSGMTATSAVVSQTARCGQVSITSTGTRMDGKPNLKWTPVKGAAKYEIYRSTSGKEGTFYRQYTTTYTSYTNTSAVNGKTYYYKVRALTENGSKSAFSPVVQITAQAAKTTATAGNRTSDGKPTLRWDAVANAAKYEVYRSETGKSGTFIRCYTTTKLTYTHISAVEGQTYYYKVRPVASNGLKGAFSPVVSNTIK